MSEKGKIIFLNGVSSAGKSTLAKTLQNRLSEPFYVLANDTFCYMSPDKFIDMDVSTTYQTALRGMYHAVKAFSDAGINTIVDDVLLKEDGYDRLKQCVELFHDCPALFVHVTCSSLEELRRREKERGDRGIGQGESQLTELTPQDTYDITVDTHGNSNEECADKIIELLGCPEKFSAFKALWPQINNNKILTQVLSKMLGEKITYANYEAKQLQGGTVGDVQLISGMAETAGGNKLPYQVVLKRSKKWERYKDPHSWRREYDFYKSDFGALFHDSLRWPECYHAEINQEETEIQLWTQYIDGVSGLDLTADMYGRAAYELGRFQGRLYTEQPAILKTLTNLSTVSYAKDFYLHYRSWSEVYDYIRDDNCEIPKHICKMLIDTDENSDKILRRIEKLPVVLCHRDFWVTNIFYTNDKILLIDWDTSGWGYLGEDIASLIADEADITHMAEYYQRCIPAYYKGFSQYVDVLHITDNCVKELILILFGYRLVEWYKFAETPDSKKLHLDTLQKIYERG